MNYEFLTLATTGGVARVTLNRPAVHNAFNAALIDPAGESSRLQQLRELHRLLGVLARV